MDYSKNPEAGAALLERVMSAQSDKYPRAEGVHMTDVVFCRRKSWYRLHGHPEAPRSAESNLQMLLGTAMGALVESIYTSEVPIQIGVAGGVVHGTLDILELSEDGKPIRVVELKETRSSSKKTPSEMSQYTEQIASYCVGTGLRDARLHVAHLLGDWSAAKTPVLNTWDVTFSADELAAWHEELSDRYALVTAVTPPSPQFSHYDWECKYCPYQDICPGGQGYATGWFAASEELMPWR